MGLNVENVVESTKTFIVIGIYMTPFSNFDDYSSMQVKHWYLKSVTCQSFKCSLVCLLGEVQIFDLGCRSLRPAATIDQGGAGHAATCLAFNHQNPGLLAVGKTDGTVSIWQLSADLTEQRPRESSQLEQLANQVAEWGQADTQISWDCWSFNHVSFLFFLYQLMVIDGFVPNSSYLKDIFS